MGRRHDWTLRPELMRRKAVPVGNWPSIAAIPPGSLVLDSDGVVKQKRVVANLDGVDVVSFPFALPADGTTGPWELEYLVSIDGTPSATYSPVVSRVGTSDNYHFRMQISPASPGYLSAVWRTSTGSYFDGRSAHGVATGKWVKVGVSVDSGKIGRLFIDGIQVDVNCNLSTWTPGTATSFCLVGAAASGTKTFTKIANVKVSRNGVLLANIPFNDGAGAICSDISGNGNSGTIIDASPVTFWDSSLIPVSLLT